MTYIQNGDCGGFVREDGEQLAVDCENSAHESVQTITGADLDELERNLRQHARDFLGLDDELHDTTTDLKIFRYVAADFIDKKDPPWGLDYVTGLTRRLYRDERFVRGELREVLFCANVAIGADSWPTYNDVVLTESMTYERDAVGFSRSRMTEIRWYREDGTVHPDTKELHKTYSPVESQKEGISRRSHIIDDLSVKTVGLITATVPTSDTYPDVQSKIELGRDFMRANKLTMDMFIMASEQEIIPTIEQAPDFWLDNIIDANGTTIRQYLLSRVDIWGIVETV